MLDLIKVGNMNITQSGSVYLESISDTLHRVRRYKLSLIDGTEMELTYKEYKLIERAADDANIRFLKLRDGTLIAIGQIRSAKPFDVVVDTRKESL